MRVGESGLYPLVFEPFLRPMPWGGRRLAKRYSSSPPDEPVGEAWLVSDHPLHASCVASGPLSGTTLRQLMQQRSTDLLGFSAARFPLLIKMLDASANLSIQVHPDDTDAARWTPDEGGKTEAWLVLEASPSAVIYAGLKPGVDKARLLDQLEAGDVAACIAQYRPKVGDCYYIPAGTVHALGGGLLVLEVQQTSDATFRLYDWDRVDSHGKPRPLHVEAALACLKLSVPDAGLRQPSRLDGQRERLVSSPFFEIDRLSLADPVRVQGPGIIVLLEGAARIVFGESETSIPPARGVLVPFSLGPCTLEGFPSPSPCTVAWIGIPKPVKYLESRSD